jgi:hypothetical protein
MSNTYTYLTTDTSDGVLNPSLLHYEVKTSSIVTEISHINTDYTDINIVMDSALTGSEEALLDAVVASHEGNAVVFSGTMSVTLIPESQTTNTVWEDVLLLNFLSIVGGDIVFSWSAEVGNSQARKNTFVRILLDDDTTDPISDGGISGESDTFFPCAGQIVRENISAGNHTVKLQFKKDNGNGTAKIRRCRLSIVRTP